MKADFLAAVLNGFSDAAFILNAERKLVAANAAAERAFGVIPPGQDFVRVMRRPEVLRLIEACKDGEERMEDVLTLDSALRGVFRVTVSRIKDEGVVISFADLSHIREAEKMRSDFIANVSHELRSPLTALTGFIETLSGPAASDPKAQQRFLALMEREAARMDRLIADLLSLSKVEVDARVKPQDRIDLNSVIDRVAATLAHRAAKNDVMLDIEAPGPPLITIGDEDQLTQVFQNLIENALKYGGSGGAVTVTMRAKPSAPGMPGKVICIDVRDEGPGIAREHLPRLTERFYRVDPGRSRDQGGTGLGLAIVKHIVQRHRGRLLIDSAPGQGATFTVLLPVAN